MLSNQKPEDPIKPDLEETTNVAKAHADIARTAGAAAREQHLRENGLEPLSVWIMIVGFIVALVAGSVLFGSGEMFSYEAMVRKGYVQGVDESGPPPIPTALAAEAYMKKGAAVYTACASCHGPDGQGGGNYPPLAGSEWVQGSGVVPGLAVLHGVKGNIEVSGKTYGAIPMPAMGDGMSDYELVSLIYFLQNNWSNSVKKIYSVEQMAQIKKISKENGKDQMTADILKKYLDFELEGDYLTPEITLNLKTGEVVEAAQ